MKDNKIKMAVAFTEAYFIGRDSLLMDFVLIGERYYLSAFDLMNLLGHEEPYESWEIYVETRNPEGVRNRYLEMTRESGEKIEYPDPIILPELARKVIDESEVGYPDQKERLFNWILGAVGL